MAVVINGVVMRKTTRRANKSFKERSPAQELREHRDWYLIKNSLQWRLETIKFPPEYLGKKVRLRVEVLDE